MGLQVILVLYQPHYHHCCHLLYPLLTQACFQVIVIHYFHRLIQQCHQVMYQAQKPSTIPSILSSLSPSMVPTIFPSVVSSNAPTLIPSSIPSVIATVDPSIIPSSIPSLNPSMFPSAFPSVLPSVYPSSSPNETPSLVPSLIPSSDPSIIPTSLPSLLPSAVPSFIPSLFPSDGHTLLPSIDPSMSPSHVPSPKVSVFGDPNVIPMLNSSSFIFDLSNCQSYSLKWVFDLSRTCSTNSSDSCRCHHAVSLINQRILQCPADNTITGCPKDCPVCDICLTIHCDQSSLPPAINSDLSSSISVGEQTKPPINQSVLTLQKNLSAVPVSNFPLSTISPISPLASKQIPTSIPSINNFSIPFIDTKSDVSSTLAFDISVCSTYERIWILDLARSCDKENRDGVSCTCYHTQLLINHGEIQCDTLDINSECPQHCAICNKCLSLQCSHQ